MTVRSEDRNGTRLASLPSWIRRLSRARTVLFAGTLFIVLMIVATTAVAVRRYNTELKDAARELRTIDLLLTEEADRSFQGVRLLLDSAADQIAAEGIDSPEAFAAREATRPVHDLLRARVAGVPQLDAVTLIGSDGTLVNYSRGWPIPSVNVADRDYFRALKDTRTTAPFMSEPVSNRGTGALTVYLARRISAPDGRFIGLILGAIELGYFDRLYGSLHLTAGDLIALWREDGVLLTRFPDRLTGQRAPPASFKPSQLSWHGVEGVFETGWTFENEPRVRVIASARTPGFPIQVNIGRDKSEILADWRREVATVGSAVALAALSTAVLLWALLRRLHALEAAAAAFRERAEAVVARERAEAVLRQSQKMDALGQLTGGIAHDFNNMLAVVIGSLNLVQRRLSKGDGNVTRYLDAAMDGATRAAALTQRLLAFSRQQPLSPGPVDVNRLVSELSELLARTLGETVRLETVLADALWHCKADPNQLENVIINLSVNARDAMPDGGRLTLETGNAAIGESDAEANELAPGDYVFIAVTDTGGGMSPAVMAKAFEPFFTTKGVGRGTGLGLSQALGFARQSGGDLKVASEPGRGSTFRLYLPRFSGTEKPVLPARAPAGTVKRGTPTEIILVVEDEERLRAFSVEALRELGYTVVHAANGPEALATIDAGQDVTLLFTDIVMPDMNGRQLADSALARRPHLKVLFTTGYTRDAVVHDGTLDPGTHFIPKPFGIDQIALKVREVLDGGA